MIPPERMTTAELEEEWRATEAALRFAAAHGVALPAGAGQGLLHLAAELRRRRAVGLVTTAGGVEGSAPERGLAGSPSAKGYAPRET